MNRSAGFTLIELLIVVAIIAVLAAIAAPNFLEAQTRSKVSRVKADHRALGVAIEVYYTDYNQYPLIDIGDFTPNNHQYQMRRATTALSTPIGYISRAFMIDIFRLGDVPRHPSRYYQFATGDQNSLERSAATTTQIDRRIFEGLWPRNVYAIISTGPTHQDNSYSARYPFSWGLPYDPSNGTVSLGDIFRNGPGNKVPKGWLDGDQSQFTQDHPF